MRRAVEALPMRPQHVLVDARSIPGVDVPQNCFNKGDGIDFSIAAASIVAKIHRDRLMDELAREHPDTASSATKAIARPSTRTRFAGSGRARSTASRSRSFASSAASTRTLFYELKRRLDTAAAAAELRSDR